MNRPELHDVLRRWRTLSDEHDPRPILVGETYVLELDHLVPFYGTGEDQLATGIGWYPQSAGVGEIGNMALVGYRLTNGEPFADLLELRVGDQVRITTCTHVYIYEIEVAPAELTVQAGDDWVLQAVPGEPGQQPTGRMITLITSQDLLPSDDRSVGFGALVSAEPR